VAQQFGVTPAGFVVKQQSQIITEINAALQDVFGVNINLLPESVFGQLTGVFSAREALIWQLLEGVYDSGIPSGAEGTSVDNILALNNLRRLAATASVTAPTTNGVPGLVLLGTAGTVIPAGKLISVQGSPSSQFSLDSQVTIAAALSAVQEFLFSNEANQGAATFTIEDSFGTVLNIPSLPYNTFSQYTQIQFSTTPTGGSHFALVLTQIGIPLQTANISTAGVYPTAGAIQSAIRALSGYGSVVVTGSAGYYVVQWVGVTCIPIVTVANNTTLAVITITNSLQAVLNNLADSSFAGGGTTGNITNGSPLLTNIQDIIGIAPNQYITGTGIPAGTYVLSISGTTVTMSANATATTPSLPITFSVYPYTDVVAVAFTLRFQISYGANSPFGQNPSSGNQPQNLPVLVANTLQNGSLVTNVLAQNVVVGAPAEAVGSATCTQTGPIIAPANTLNVIDTPVSGWTAVNNSLDVIPGTNIETDTQAMVRRSNLLQANANGPLQSIVDKVEEVPGVTAAIGFQNLTNAAMQTVDFSAVPASGSFSLQFGSNGFTFTTGSIPYTATAATVQAAINAISGYTVLVTGSFANGFNIDFNGSTGGQSQALIQVSSNSLEDSVPNPITITPAYGRPPHSVEIVVEGGDPTAIAQAIYNSKPGGIQTYGNSVIQTGTIVSSGQSITSISSTAGIFVGMSVSGTGIPPGTTVKSVAASSVTLSQAATSSGTFSFTFVYAIVVTDSAGNEYIISFSRPTSVAFFVIVVMVTDLIKNGIQNPNPMFNPGSVQTIQNDIVEIGNATPIGGTVVALGTNGLIGAFNSVPGILAYSMIFSEAALFTSNGDLTEGSTTMSSVVSTAGVVPGMFIVGQGIPPNTVVVSAGGGSITMSQEATENTTGGQFWTGYATNVPLLPEQQAQFESFNVQISYV